MSGSMSVKDTTVAAWQGALAAEQQAAFGYALLGPHLGAERRGLARSCQAIHEQLRDDTADALAAAGVEPGAPQGDYPQLYGVAPLTLAAGLEDDCAAAWRFFYAAVAAVVAGGTNARLRADAQRGLIDSAVRATRWRMIAGAPRPVVAFPGTSAQK
jgi:hypothetical protein